MSRDGNERRRSAKERQVGEKKETGARASTGRMERGQGVRGPSPPLPTSFHKHTPSPHVPSPSTLCRQVSSPSTPHRRNLFHGTWLPCGAKMFGLLGQLLPKLRRAWASPDLLDAAAARPIVAALQALNASRRRAVGCGANSELWATALT